MHLDPRRDRLSLATAEEVLRTIYGDDFKGCTVSLEQIAAIIDREIEQRNAAQAELLGLYEKVVEALHLLSTAPDKTKVIDPAELGTLLSERLDAIHAVTTKTTQTTALFKAQHPDLGGSVNQPEPDAGPPAPPA